MNDLKSYYVYVYIDPRNFQEFYYGKGIGNRKLSHLHDEADTEKVRIIRAIRKEGLEPIIRVVARNLSESEALLVEKTLIWKLGRNLSNISSGHFASNFRPHDTLHRDLFGFDFSNGIYYVNVGEGETRSWDDCRKYGFMAAGQNWKKWGSKLYALNEGDIVVAFLAKHGYVGVGRVTERAMPVSDFRFNGKPLSACSLVQPNICKKKIDDPKECDQLIGVEWLKSLDRSQSLWKSKAALFTTQLIVASLENQPKTLEYLETNLGLSFKDLMARNAEKQAA